MKKFCNVCMLITLLCFVLLSFAKIGPASAADINVIVDGNLVSFSDQKPIIDQNGRTLVPVRFPAENMNASVEWVNATNQVKIINRNHSFLPDSEILLTVGQKEIFVNGTSQVMDTTPAILGGRTMVPIRFISEYMGAVSKWDNTSNTVYIFTKGQSEREMENIISTFSGDLSAKPDSTNIGTSYASYFKSLIPQVTGGLVQVPTASYDLLVANEDLFFSKNRSRFSLLDKALWVSGGDIDKNVSKYNATIIQLESLTIDQNKETSLPDGNTLTTLIGHTGGRIDAITNIWRDATYFQIFHIGTTGMNKGADATVIGVPVGESTLLFTNALGNQYTMPSYVIISGNVYGKLAAYLDQIEKGKNAPIKFTPEYQEYLDEIEERNKNITKGSTFSQEEWDKIVHKK